MKRFIYATTSAALLVLAFHIGAPLVEAESAGHVDCVQAAKWVPTLPGYVAAYNGLLAWVGVSSIAVSSNPDEFALPRLGQIIEIGASTTEAYVLFSDGEVWHITRATGEWRVLGTLQCFPINVQPARWGQVKGEFK